MTDAFTNRGLCLQVTGTNLGTWGQDLNVNDITITDSIIGSTQALTINTGTVAITSTQSQNMGFALSGVLSGNVILTLPFNLATGAVTAVGGNFLFSNLTTGAYTVTVKTVAAGSTGVAVPQNLRALLYSNGTNVYYANDGGKSLASSVLGYAGNPDGVVACTPASATTPADMLWDYTDDILYICTGAPNTWSPAIPAAVTVIPTPMSGYLTLSSSATNPILANDAVAATTVYYTPVTGDVIGIPNGSTFSTYIFSQLALALSSTYQVANGIYDVFAFVNSNAAAIGFGPIWTTGGGSVTSGSCARGTGAGSTQLSRLLGTYVNTVSMTLNNGATTYSIGAMCGTYLGSVYIDSTNGQVTCHVSYGQSRKWGVFNAENRNPIYLQGGDPTANWTYDTNTARPANGNSANSLTFFSGLAEEPCDAQLVQFLQAYANNGTTTFLTVAAGWGSTSVFSGTSGGHQNQAQSNVVSASTVTARYLAPPTLGIVTVTALENTQALSVASGAVYYGSQSSMMLSAGWMG